MNKRILEHLLSKIVGLCPNTYKSMTKSTTWTDPPTYGSRFRCGKRGYAFDLYVGEGEARIVDFNIRDELVVDLEDPEVVNKIINYINTHADAVERRY